MTVGNLTERLINESSSALGTNAASIVNNNSSPNLASINSSTSQLTSVTASSATTACLDKEEPVTSSSSSSLLSSSSNLNNSPTEETPSIKSFNATSSSSTNTAAPTTTNNSTSSNAHSLGYLKKMRSAPRTGRNHAGAKYLASQYTKVKRLQEYIGISFCLPLIVYNFTQFLAYFDVNKWYVVFFAAVIGILTADLISGIVHWAADSYGSVEMFLIGKNLLRNFREHHIDPTAITRHDFVETNGDNLTAIVPLLGYLAYKFNSYNSDQIVTDYNWNLYWFLVAVFLSLTNQFHKWSHTYFGLPRYITILQDLHIILPRIHHRVHHVTPHDTYFCITTGWLNYPLELIDFWPRLENAVFKLTGVRPRTDDMKWALKTE